MAAVIDMGEVDEIHSKEETIKDGIILNGDTSSVKSNDEENEAAPSEEVMDVDEVHESEENEVEATSIEIDDDDSNQSITNEHSNVEVDDKDDDEVEIHSIDNSDDEVDEINELDDEDEIHEVEDDDDEENEIHEVNDDDDEVNEVHEINEIPDDEDDVNEDHEVNEIPVEDNKKDEETKEASDDVSEQKEEHEEVHIICEDNEIVETNSKADGDNNVVEKDKGNSAKEDSVVLNDSGDGDVEIIEESDIPKENGKSFSPESNEPQKANDDDNDDMVITLDTPTKKSKKQTIPFESPRRSARNLNKKSRKSYIEQEKEDSSEEESDIEEIMPQDPLAVGDPLATSNKVTSIKKQPPQPPVSSTIVVKDTKRLVEIASKSNSSNSGKKEPTLVIIDTNSILSGRGPIPINQKPSISQSYPVLPVALPAQGVYPPNMRATITPIPMNSMHHSKATTISSLPPVQFTQVQTTAIPSILTPSPQQQQKIQQQQQKIHHQQQQLKAQPSQHQTKAPPPQQPAPPPQPQQPPPPPQPPILPSLTDDMFVVEAPSFIVPYVYEKPPVKDLKEFVTNFAKELRARLIAEEKERILAEQREKEERELKELNEKKEKELKELEEKKEKELKELEEKKEKELKELNETKEKELKEKESNEEENEKDEETKQDKEDNKDDDDGDKKDEKDVEVGDEKMEIDDAKAVVDNEKEKTSTSEEEKIKDGGDDEEEEEIIEKKSEDTKDIDSKKELFNLDIPEPAPSSSSSSSRKPYSYFESPLGKFFIDIGHNLVQEYVQTDLLKQQKRKREREGGKNIETNKTISSLIKNLEYTKENNEPYHMPIKKCEFCSFKTESALAMAFHLETPHMKNFVYRCNFCPYEIRSPHDILFHMEAEHTIRGRLERAPAFHQCPNCPFEDNQKGKLSRHLVACTRKFKPDRNLEPPLEWEPPAKIPRVPRMKQSNLTSTAAMYQAMAKSTQYQLMQKMQSAQSALNRGRGRPSLAQIKQPPMMRTPTSMIYKSAMSGGSVLLPTNYQLSGNQLYQVVGGQEMGGRIGTGIPMTLLPNISSATSSLTIQQQTAQNKAKPLHQPSISITPLPRNTSAPPAAPVSKPGDSNSKNSFVICEICDGYIKDLEQLRNHMQWIHKVKIHPKMIYNRPPLNCQKCQFRFFTDQGLERHLLGSHGLVTSSMQEAANKSKDSGRCPVCGRVYQWKLLNHVARDHNMTLKPAHLSYKCTVCTATFGMYKQFENHVYSAHSVVAKRVMDKKSSNSPQTSANNSSAAKNSNDSLLKPLKINDEITIIPQMPKSSGASTSKEESSSSPVAKNSISVTTTPSTSKNELSRAERLARRKTSAGADN